MVYWIKHEVRPDKLNWAWILALLFVRSMSLGMFFNLSSSCVEEIMTASQGKIWDNVLTKVRVCVHIQLLHLCLTFCNPKDHSPPGSSVHGVSQKKYWSGLPCPPPGDRPNPGIEPGSPDSHALQADSLLLSHYINPLKTEANIKTIFTDQNHPYIHIYRKNKFTVMWWEKFDDDIPFERTEEDLKMN